MKAPAFIERATDDPAGQPDDGIAGVKAPAFIERLTVWQHPTTERRIAGVKAPAFIERAGRGCQSSSAVGLRG